MGYIAYHFTVKPVQPGSEILIAMLGEFGFESFTFTDQGFVGYIPEEEDESVWFQDLEFEDFTYEYKKEKIADTNWNEEWENNFEPVIVDDLLCIRAPFHSPVATVKEEVVIMPKMSFGTGHHQTTRLMCRELFALDLSGKRVLDMGCGTGVLAIVAAKRGAGDVTGIDIDQWSVDNSLENCKVNAAEKIKILKGDVDLLENENPFDIILANINRNILKRHLPTYSEKLSSGGMLFLSGFFLTDVSALRTEAENHSLRYEGSEHEGDWAMIRLKKL